MSRSRGKHSSSRTCKAEEQLEQLALSPEVSRISHSLGEESDLHIVGGTIREVLGGGRAIDIDLATALPPTRVAELLSNAGIRAVETGIRHGTITAVLDGEHFEITTFRKPGAPECFSSSIAEDLSGRDFTINAIAYSVFNRNLIDPHCGIEDLLAEKVRSVGEPGERFAEDPLRIMRMVRFGPAEGRVIEEKTLREAAALVQQIESVSPERIRVELERILLSRFADQGLRLIETLGLLRWILPECLPSVGFPQNRFHVEDVWSHTLRVVQDSPSELTVRLAALFHDLGKPHTLSIGEGGERHFYKHELESERLCLSAMRRLRFSKDETRTVALLVRSHMRPIECGPPGARRLLRDLGEQFERWKQLKIADKPPLLATAEFEQRVNDFERLVAEEREREKGSPFRMLAIDGEDLIGIGFCEGILLGRVLEKLLELVSENPERNTREDLLAEAAKLLRAEGF